MEHMAGEAHIVGLAPLVDGHSKTLQEEVIGQVKIVDPYPGNLFAPIAVKDLRQQRLEIISIAQAELLKEVARPGHGAAPYAVLLPVIVQPMAPMRLIGEDPFDGIGDPIAAALAVGLMGQLDKAFGSGTAHGIEIGGAVIAAGAGIGHDGELQHPKPFLLRNSRAR